MNIQEELKINGNYPSFPMGGINFPGSPKYNTPVTPLANIELALKRDAAGALRGEQIWAPQGGDVVTFCPVIMPDNIARAFVIEAGNDPKYNTSGGKDFFGVEWEFVPSAGGSMVRPGSEPLIPKVYDEDWDMDLSDFAQWENYVKFPDLSKYDWAGNAEKNKDFLAADERAVMPWVLTGLFERLISFVEFENAAVALKNEDQQPHVHRLFDKLADFYDELFGYYQKYYDAKLFYFHDDWGSQRSPFFSPDTVREMIAPYLKRVCDSAHKRGQYIILHSCGKIEPLVPVMVECGVDVWSGQPMNDRLQVLKDNHGKIYIEFGPDTGGFGAPPLTPEEQKASIDAWLDTFGEYIDSIFVNASFGGNELLYKTIYEYSRKKFAK
jgi:hypothetical protein